MITAFDHHRVLIVDDEIAIRDILERFFRSAGCIVGCAANGVEGLQLFYQAPWDVVVIDRGMPEMNGQEMATRIHATHPHVPLILITGLPHLVTERELFFAVLPKPFRPADLLEQAMRAVEGRVRCAEPLPVSSSS